MGLQIRTLARGTCCFMNCLNPVVSAVHAMCIAVSGTLKSSGRLVYQLHITWSEGCRTSQFVQCQTHSLHICEQSKLRRNATCTQKQVSGRLVYQLHITWSEGCRTSQFVQYQNHSLRICEQSKLRRNATCTQKQVSGRLVYQLQSSEF